MKPLQIPNLPCNDVSAVLLDSRADKKVTGKLNLLDIEVIPVYPHPDVYPAVSCHPDIMFQHISGKVMVYAPNTPRHMIDKLCGMGFDMRQGQTFLQNKYPGTIPYNIARVGNLAFHNTRFTDPVVRGLLKENGVELIHVNQGYSKCLTCIVNENSIITSDNEICKKASAAGLDVLLVEPDKSIKLEPFEMGFIGGTAGLISKNKLFFAGDIFSHKNFKEINNFLSLKAIDMVIINDEPLIDLGTIIPILER